MHYRGVCNFFREMDSLRKRRGRADGLGHVLSSLTVAIIAEDEIESGF